MQNISGYFYVIVSLGLFFFISCGKISTIVEPPGSQDIQTLDSPSNMQEYTIGAAGSRNWFLKIYKSYNYAGSSLNDFTIAAEYSTHVSEINSDTIADADSKHPALSQEFIDSTKKFFSAVKICKAQPKSGEQLLTGYFPFERFKDRDKDSIVHEIEAKRPQFHDQSLLVVCDDRLTDWEKAFQKELSSNNAIDDEIKNNINLLLLNK